ncbi:MAG: EAL domain-containing protein [Magnetococcales bacterium]|nr:EAL domain-containing protein [Magnetococcales bacterium]
MSEALRSYNKNILDIGFQQIFKENPPIEDFISVIEQEGDSYISQYRDLKISSVFQPIFSPSHHKVIGYEGLLRGIDKNGNAITPNKIFAMPDSPQESLYLDRLSRFLHVRNFSRSSLIDGQLFINLSPDVILHSHQQNFANFTTELVKAHDIDPARVVIEILESSINDEKALLEVINHYRQVGYLIAVDDFGAGESNMDRLWKLEPDIIKLDRSLIVNARLNQRAKRLLPGLVNLIHQIGGLVLLEGIESKEEAMIAIDADVDMVQGYAFARPHSLFQISYGEKSLFKALSRLWHVDEQMLAQRHVSWLTEQANDFWQGVESIDGTFIPDELLHNSKALRWYILDEKGWQIGENRQGDFAKNSESVSNKKLLDCAKGVDWSRRPYYRRAIRYPGEVQVAGPYFSIPDSSYCVTFSISRTSDDGELTIICCDFEWQEKDGGQTYLISGSMGPWSTHTKQN